MKSKLPKPLAVLVEQLKSDLPTIARADFSVSVENAAAGRDLGRAHWDFLRMMLARMPEADYSPTGIKAVLTGLELLSAGHEWPDAAKIAESLDGYFWLTDVILKTAIAAHDRDVVSIANGLSECCELAIMASPNEDAEKEVQRDTLLALMASAPIGAEAA